MDRLQLQELISGLGSAVEDFGRAGAVARGGTKDSGQFYQGLAQSAGRARDRELEDERKKADAVRQAVLDNYKAKDEARAAAKFEAEASTGEDDPKSRTSQVMRNVLSKRFPDQNFDGMTARQMKALPLKTDSESGSSKRFSTLTDDDGKVRAYLVDLNTGEKTLVGNAGYAQNTFEDPVTGERVVFNPSIGAARPLGGQASRGSQSVAPSMPTVPVVPQVSGQPMPSTALMPGETPKQRDVRVGLETKQAEGKIRSEQERSGEKRVSKERLKNLELMENDLMKLHESASLSGPVLGQAGSAARSLGFSPDEKSSRFQGQVQLWANEYIKEISGAGVPVAEFEERFKPLLPSITDSEALAQEKFDVFKDFVKRTYASKFGADDKNAAARKWLEANPNDPRAEAIRKKTGGN